MKNSNLASLALKLDIVIAQGDGNLGAMTEALKTHINACANVPLKNDITHIPARYHRSWITGSFRRHVRKLRSAYRYAIKDDRVNSMREIRFGRLWLGQAMRMMEAVSFFLSIGKNDGVVCNTKPRQGHCRGDYDACAFLATLRISASINSRRTRCARLPRAEAV